VSPDGTRAAQETPCITAPRAGTIRDYGGMNLGLRLAGSHTIVFQCACFFAGGDDTGVPGWRLCAEHVNLRAMIADAFGEDEGECVVACRLSLQRV